MYFIGSTPGVWQLAFQIIAMFLHESKQNLKIITLFFISEDDSKKLDKNQDEIAKEKSEVETIPISDAVRERPIFIFDQLSIHKDAIGKINLFFKRAIQVTFYLAL